MRTSIEEREMQVQLRGFWAGGLGSALGIKIRWEDDHHHHMITCLLWQVTFMCDSSNDHGNNYDNVQIKGKSG